MLWLAAILFFVIRHKTKKIQKIGWACNFGFLLLGVWAVMLAPLPFGIGNVGSLLAGSLRWSFGLVGSWTDVAIGPAAGIALIIVLICGLLDIIKDKKPDGAAKVMVFAVPVLAMLAGGTLAERLLNVVNTVGHVGPNVVSTITA